VFAPGYMGCAMRQPPLGRLNSGAVIEQHRKATPFPVRQALLKRNRAANGSGETSLIEFFLLRWRNK
jgi:hypothetical protein